MRTATAALFTLLLLGSCKTDDGGFTFIDRGVCDTLIECAASIAPEARDQYIATWGEGGACWQNGGPTQWAACRDACREALDGLNLLGQATGSTCGTCNSDNDCGDGRCEDGICIGEELGDDETGGDQTGGDQTDESEAESGEDTDTSGCYPPPDICLRFIRCVGAILPGQAAEVEKEYGEGGACWCGTDADAQACYAVCVSQIDAALDQFPTVAECHAVSCSLDELDPSQPYGPVTNGSCPAWNGTPQLPVANPFGLPGAVCAPPCSGIAQSCPSHSQTVAPGSCYLSSNNTNYCVSRCYVDSAKIFPSGAQCQCGATCQPHGGPDGDGNLRGICTFE